MTVSEIYNKAMAGEIAPVHYVICNNDRVEENPKSTNRLGIPPIQCWSKEGTLLGTYATLQEAQDATGVDGSQISMCCKGKVKTCSKGRYIFTRETH